MKTLHGEIMRKARCGPQRRNNDARDNAPPRKAEKKRTIDFSQWNHTGKKQA